MSDTVQIGLRPAAYFKPRPLVDYLLAQVKNAAQRQYLQSLIDEGCEDEVRELLEDGALTEPADTDHGDHN